MSDFLSLNTALSGLHAAQAAIEVTSDNIANANTPGHTRQRVDLAARRPHDMPFGQVGAGVDIVEISRARDQFLDMRVRDSSALAARVGVRADLLGRVERSMSEPEGGIASALGELWASFEDLALDPTDRAARSAVVGALESVADRVRGVASAWDDAADLAGEELTAATGNTNELLRELASVNQALVEGASTVGENNDLLDRRDVIVDRLAEMGGFRFVEQEYGAMRVSAGGIGVVDGTVVIELVADPDTGAVTIASGEPATVSGMLGGYRSLIADDLPGLRTGIDDFASELATLLNTTHAAGYTPSGASGGDLLTVGASGADSLQVALTDPDDLAAAASGSPVAEYDAGNAEALADLRSAESAAGGTATIEAVWRSIVADVGSATAAARTASRSQLTLQQAAESARSNAHGVSIDEEMVNLIRFQRAFEAAGRVMSAVDQMLDMIVNRLGVVGR